MGYIFKVFLFLIILLTFAQENILADTYTYDGYQYTDNDLVVYTYDIDEQIRILEDRDYAQYLKQQQKKKAVRDKARREQARIRQQQQKAQEKARKEQRRLRRAEQKRFLDQLKEEDAYQKEVLQREKQQERDYKQYMEQKRKERQKVLRRQAANKAQVYKLPSFLRKVASQKQVQPPSHQ